MTIRHKGRRLLAGLGAVGAALALTLAGATSAQAAPMPETSDIEITKLSTPPGGPGENASGIASGQEGGPEIPEGATPIEGVQFEAYAVPVDGDPGSNQWQQNIAGISLAQAQELVGANPTPVSDFAPTGGDGVTSWTDAPRGLYLLRETSAPAGVTPSADFLVAVPLTDPLDSQSWLETIHIYPKNSLVTVTKGIDDGASVAVGEDVTWTITADIPRDPEISEFQIVDELDPRLTHVDSVMSLTAGDVTLTEGTHYTLTHTPETNTVDLTFTEAGRAALVEAWTSTNGAAQVSLEIVTTVNETTLPDLDPDNAIVNTATLSVNDAEEVATPGDLNGPAALQLGEFSVAKTDSQSEEALEGAVFSVYRTEADAANRENPIVIDGQTTFATSAQGTVTISGLFLSSFVDGESVDEASTDYRSYWLHEVEPPEGYQLLAEPIEVEVLGVGADATSYSIQNAPNADGSGFVLPLTGGTGTWFLTLGGIVLLIVVAAIVIRRRMTDTGA